MGGKHFFAVQLDTKTCTRKVTEGFIKTKPLEKVSSKGGMGTGNNNPAVSTWI